MSTDFDPVRYSVITEKNPRDEPFAGLIPVYADKGLGGLRQDFHKRHVQHHPGRKTEPQGKDRQIFPLNDKRQKPAHRSGCPGQKT